jgi:hypothetical protein
MMIAGIAGAWLILAFVLVVAWSRLHAGMRAADGVDESLYIDGLDDASLAEAA